MHQRWSNVNQCCGIKVTSIDNASTDNNSFYVSWLMMSQHRGMSVQYHMHTVTVLALPAYCTGILLKHMAQMFQATS